MKKNAKNSKNSNLPEDVELYIETMKSLIHNDEEAYNDVFGKSEWTDEDIFWELFEAKVMINWSESGEPALTPEQFKAVHFETVKISMEQSLQKLVNMGLIEQTDDGFMATQKGANVFNQNKENEG